MLPKLVINNFVNSASVYFKSAGNNRSRNSSFFHCSYCNNIICFQLRKTNSLSFNLAAVVYSMFAILHPRAPFNIGNAIVIFV